MEMECVAHSLIHFFLSKGHKGQNSSELGLTFYLHNAFVFLSFHSDLHKIKINRTLLQNNSVRRAKRRK
jgi:hypothetical protein